MLQEPWVRDQKQVSVHYSVPQHTGEEGEVVVQLCDLTPYHCKMSPVQTTSGSVGGDHRTDWSHSRLNSGSRR